MNSAPPLSDELHKPVLLQETVELINPKPGDKYLDLTAGYGGHATKIIEKIGNPSLATLVDRDVFAFEYLNQQPFLQGATIVHSSYDNFVDQLKQNNQKFDIILLDLGVSSPQLDRAPRGFSYKQDGPLDMRMDQSQDLTAATIVNNYSTDQLRQILWQNAEVKNSKAIAKAIVENRPFSTTKQLAEVVDNYKTNNQKQPNKLVFQAIRIEVNAELKQLQNTLPNLLELLNVGGRVAVISFHSLEDRLIKHFFKSHSRDKYEAQLKLVNKKAIDSSPNDVTNPRARSAKLRVAIKIKN